jgi:hypothetical protein
MMDGELTEHEVAVEYSYDPISHPDPVGLGAPRWSIDTAAPSIVVQSETGMASMAGLPDSNAWVGVGPPLFCSGPSCRPGTIKSPPEMFCPQVLSLNMLCPMGTGVTNTQSVACPSVGLATILFLIVISAFAKAAIPSPWPPNPPNPSAWFS